MSRQLANQVAARQQHAVDSRRPRPDIVQLPAGRTSSPDGYADEKRNSGAGAVGMGMLTGDMSDDEDDVKPPGLHPHLHPPAPVMSPPPPGPNPSSRPRLSPLQPQPARPRPAFMPPTAPPVLQVPLRPATTEPHTLHVPPATPIVAKFASGADSGEKNRTTVFGDVFWERFNKAARDEKQPARGPQAKSSGGADAGSSAFLREYTRGAGRFNKWVWCCSILLLVCIAGGIGAGWYFTHNEPPTQPKAIGGSANENSLSPHVAPTSTPATTKTTSSHKAAATTSAPAVRRRRHRSMR